MASVSTSRELLRTETWSSLAAKTWLDESLATSWAMLTEYLHTLLAMEDLPLVELASKLSTVALNDEFGVSGGVSSQDLSQVILESFGLTDDDMIVRDMLQVIVERLRVDDLVSNGLHTQQTDGFTVEDFKSLNFKQDILQVMRFTDAMVRDYAANHEVDLRIYALPDKVVAKPFESAFGLRSVIVKAVQQHTLRALEIASTPTRTVNFLREWEEAIQLEDLAGNHVGKRELRELNIAEQLIVPAWMVIGDMTVMELAKGREYSYENFLASLDIGGVPGWTPWRNFVPGDYEYSKAMFRIVMDSISADRALIEECVAAVDVPDVIDRGAARITDASAGIYVEFNREYHVIPEMSLTARGGTGNPSAAELMGSPSLIGFTARLRDTVTGDYVTGTFTWASHGY